MVGWLWADLWAKVPVGLLLAHRNRMAVRAFTKRKTSDLRGRRRLTTAQLEAVNSDGRHPLDDLLYFRVQNEGRTRSFEIRFLSPETGKRRDMSLGRFPEIDAARAREVAAEVRGMLARRVDPLEERRRLETRSQSAVEPAFTLRVALKEHFEIESARWRNAKYVGQWLSRMNAALDPLLDRPLASLTKGDLHDRLVNINRESHDTAIKVRANLDKLFRRFSGTRGIAEAHNPAAALTGLLPRTRPVQHHPALDWRKAPAFVRTLRDSSTWISVRLGFEWLIFSGARTDAVTHARWSQVDEKLGYWRANPLEAENKRRGDVPLTPRMREILDAMRPHRVSDSDWIFPSAQRRVRSKKRIEELGHPPISNEAFRQVISRLKLEITAHGFRSTYKTWAVESPQGRSLQLPEAVVEAALGHSERDAIKAAYTRADYWDMRIRLAEAWHDFLNGKLVKPLDAS